MKYSRTGCTYVLSFIQEFSTSYLFEEQETPKGPFIYYVITFLGFLDPPPPLRKHAFSTANNQKLALFDPPPPLQVIT